LPIKKNKPIEVETLLTELTVGILTITINRPDKLNALNRMVLTELNAVLDQVYENEEIHGVIITGAGPKSFVAGADISEFMSLRGEEGAALAKKGQDIFLRIEQCPKPVIAAVNGFALGGGCELAMSCHIRMASTAAKFGQPEVNLGIIPGYGGTQRLAQLVGKGKAFELTMSGNMVDAQQALQLGLVNHVTEPDQLIPETIKLLQTILSKSPMAVAKVIEAVNAGYNNKVNGYDEEVRLFGECVGSDEMNEGVSAFLEKRKPVFRS
jgi:enoyl-CoA hydratase